MSATTDTTADARTPATTRGAVAAAASGTSRGGDASPPVLAVVVPCFDEEPVVRQTAARLCELLRRLTAAGKIDPSSFVYFVDDGSRDGTWAAVEELHGADAAVKGLKLARNTGTQNALLAGLLGVKERADCVVTIDADLQQDEGVIETFLEKFRAGAHIVYGVRRTRSSDSVWKRAASSFFYNLMWLMGARIIRHHSEYRLVSRKAVEAISEYREYNLFLRGIF
ncbi:MAG: glycosyltransferase family 2 protein, partial [Acidobacteria bacterium]|nr:glycosyltransferase family 2 protein [Acidobacteriota bacterium]